MNALIDRIVLFGCEDEIRTVTFEKGLNIITGDSKTGKSALIEIIDYCLFSSRSTIPSGIITNFAELFCIVLNINDIHIVIARPNPKTSESNQAYFSVVTELEIIDSLTMAYFDKISLRKIKGDIQEELEKHLGLSVLDTRPDEDLDSRSYGKASIRHMMPFLFQHQNLIANKHSLFYSFDDFYKRDKTIKQLPVFLGWVDNRYYRLIKEIEEKRKKLNAELNLQKKIATSNESLSQRIKELIRSYYNLIGKELETELSFAEIQEIGLNLPEISVTSYSNRDLDKSISELKEERTSHITELYEVNSLITQLEQNEVVSQQYHGKLFEISSINNDNNNFDITCPLCFQEVSQISQKIKSFNNSKRKLVTELNKMTSYHVDNSKQITELRKSRDELKSSISELSSRIEFLQEQSDDYKSRRELRDQSMKMKGVIETTVRNILNENNLGRRNVDIDQLKKDIKTLSLDLANYNIEDKIKTANYFINERMNQICNILDFEDDLRPGKLYFHLDSFDFYYKYKDKDKISLSEMGSGANWLACHLSLFLSLLHLICKEEKSSIPSFLILDQPSQVYFPRTYRENDEEINVDENIKQVKNIFKVLKDQIEVIREDCNRTPQIIVLDHAYESEFKDFVRKKWTREGEKLI